MGIIIPLVVIVAIGTLSYWWYKWFLIRKKLNWLPLVPGLPIIGNALDLRDSTVSLDVFTNYTNRYNGLCSVNIATKMYIVATDYDFLEYLLTTMNVLNKSTDYKYIQKWLGTGLLTAEGPKWKKYRKILTPAFHFSILEQFVDVFESNGRTMVELLEKETEKEFVNIDPYVTMCTLDIISESAMGVSINAQRNVHSDYVFAVKEMCRITVERTFSPLKKFNTLYPLTADFYNEMKYVKTLHSYTQSVINKKKRALKNSSTNKETEKDELGVKKKMAFLDLLLQATVDGKPLSNNDIREEVDTFMFEGHDTTSSAISFAFYCLSCNPDVQAQAVEEQKQIFGPDRYRAVTHRDLQDMKYLELVIKETLRLFPSVPFYGRSPDTDVQYKDGKIIPKGVNIVIFAFGANRNPKYHSNPETFDPNRFQSIDGKLPYSYLPFSAGPRNCIGQKFALLEMKSVISMVLRSFVLSSPSNFKPILAAETVLKSTNGINIKLRKRDW